MAYSSRRERKKVETKERILESAISLIGSKGFDETKIEEITQHADVGKGTFYNYFSCKEEVALEFSRRVLQDILYPNPLHNPLNTFERLRVLLHEWAKITMKNKEVSWAAMRNRDEGSYDSSLYYRVIPILKKGQLDGEIKQEINIELIAESFAGMVIQRFISWYVDDQRDLIEDMDIMLDIFKNGMVVHIDTAG